MKKLNADRAKKAKRIVLESYDLYDVKASITDILTDLRHLCDAEDFSIAELDRIAHYQYLEEKYGN